MSIAITDIFAPSAGAGAFKLTLADDIDINNATAAAGGNVDTTDLLICDTDAAGTTRKITVSQLPFNDYTHPNHSGEVTSVADGATTIVNDAVTYAKMQNVSATDKVLGRATAGAGNVEEIACTAFARSILDDANEAIFKATVNLEIGTDVLAQQTIGIADDNLLEVDDADAANTDYARFTANGLQGRDATEVKTDLGLVIGTNVQAYDAGLTNLAGVAMAANKFYYTSGDNVHVAADVTAAGRAILDDANAAAQATTLGLGTGDSPTFAGLTLTGLLGVSLAGVAASFRNTVATGSNQVVQLYSNGVEDDEGQMGLFLKNDAAADIEYARIMWTNKGEDAGDEVGLIEFSIMDEGVLSDKLAINAGGIEITGKITVSGTVSAGRTLLTGDGTYGLRVNQGADSLGLYVYGHDDKNHIYSHLYVDANGYTHLTSNSSVFIDAPPGGNLYFKLGDRLGGSKLYIKDSFEATVATINSDGSAVFNKDLTVSGIVVMMANLPGADPTVAGQLWNDGGVVTVSAG